MEKLFSTPIAIQNNKVVYRVVFDKEKYNFISENNIPAYSSFSFQREKDEWVDEEGLPPEIKKQAIDALEKYLMKQH